MEREGSVRNVERQLRLIRTIAKGRKYRAYTRRDIDRIPRLAGLPKSFRDSMKAVASVLPFRVNNYVVEDLIEWDNIPSDPIFQLTFPQPEMLESDQFERMMTLIHGAAPAAEIEAAAREIQQSLNPHPGGQMDMNVPLLDGEPLPGMQHKYRETVLFFPAPGQSCHSYCTYCFRWAQFAGCDKQRFAHHQVDKLVAYLKKHQDVSNVLITGGDPMVMKASVLRRYIEPLLAPELEHVSTIRIGTKAPAYWPYRFISDKDADEILWLFERVRAAGRHLALMAHYSHPRELEPPVARLALRRICRTGAVVRCQAPLIRHVNDSAECWVAMWREQERLGAVPYYMFVERNTGAERYFGVPLAEAFDIFNRAYRRVSGLARTVKGPSMSARPGKVAIDGITTVKDEKVFALRFLQGRRPGWVGKPFYARFDPRAYWFDDLRPAFGEKEFFFEKELRAISLEREPDHEPPVPAGRV
jgi:KamA family protein